MSDPADITHENAVTERDMRLTAAAGRKMGELMTDAEHDVQGIRVFVAGGGCGGMSYGMTYAEAISDYDCTLEGDGYRIVVDAVALNFLRGCEIDFDQDRFMFKNVFQAVGGSGRCGGCGGGGY